MKVNAYLSFEGRCDEAIAFYKSALGAEVNMLMRFKETPKDACPEGSMPPAHAEKVMHGELRIGESTVFVTDGRCSGKPKFDGVTLSITAANPAQAEKLFNALAVDGKISMPLGKTFFATSFGMVNDRFGVIWMVLSLP